MAFVDSDTDLKLNVLTLCEFVLSKDDYAARPPRGRDGCASQTTRAFIDDFRAGVLNRYRGTFVAYKKGILIGQSSDQKLLLLTTGRTYGLDQLAVFPVPRVKESLESAINNGAGTFLYSTAFPNDFPKQ